MSSLEKTCVGGRITPEEHWDFTQSIDLTRQLVEDRMFPMTLRGLEDAMGYLAR